MSQSYAITFKTASNPAKKCSQKYGLTKYFSQKRRNSSLSFIFLARKQQFAFYPYIIKHFLGVSIIHTMKSPTLPCNVGRFLWPVRYVFLIILFDDKGTSRSFAASILNLSIASRASGTLMRLFFLDISNFSFSNIYAHRAVHFALSSLHP